MRIGIDVTPAFGPPSGYKRYIESFLESLAKIDRKNRYFLCAFFWSGDADRLKDIRLPDAPNFDIRLRKVPQRLVLPAEHYLGLRIQQRLLPPDLDLFHGTAAVLPRLRGVRSVLTMHHVGKVGKGFSLFDRFYHNTLPAASLRRADRVIAISKSTRAAILEAYKLDPARVSVIYNGGANEHFHPRPVGKLPPAVEVPYFLSVSAFNLRKNLKVLVQAFALRAQAGADKHRLVFVGETNDYTGELKSLARELGVGERLDFIGPVGIDELRVLYQRAEALVYPSLLEGFGLPLLEAMACGAPVIAAEASCLPEVGGDGALYFPPQDAGSLAAQMKVVAEDAGRRRDLVEKGFRRAKEFTWARNARETLSVYQDAMQGGA